MLMEQNFGGWGRRLGAIVQDHSGAMVLCDMRLSLKHGFNSLIMKRDCASVLAKMKKECHARKVRVFISNIISLCKNFNFYAFNIVWRKVTRSLMLLSIFNITIPLLGFG